MSGRDGFVGVFDSGAGGVSVLRALASELPHERFSYYGDAANAPYGNRSVEEVREFSDSIVERMVARGAKAVVIACNTATSAAATCLRKRWPELPIVGVEPALKPAVASGGHILVMATEMTLRLDKYRSLARDLGVDADVVACTGLAELVEAGDLDSPEIERLIADLVGGYRGTVESVVLGCTHYPFVTPQIKRVLGPVRFFDGSRGAARQLKRLLVERGIDSRRSEAGGIEYGSSDASGSAVCLYRSLMERSSL